MDSPTLCWRIFKCMCFQEVDNYDTRNDVTLPGVSADGQGVTRDKLANH